MKDPNRFLTDSQKAECLAAAGYKCEGGQCNNRDLSNQPFEFHHTKLHSEFGLTTRFRTQVLCVQCHRLSHTGDMKEQFSESGWESLRKWQKDAIERFIESENEKTFVLEAAPGAGKSRFAAFACQYMMRSEHDINHAIFIAPWVPILSSVKKEFHPLQLEVRDKFHYDKKSGRLQHMPNVDVTLDTYAGFCNRTTVDTLRGWQEKKGFSFMLILDEIHHTNTVSGKWGPSISAIAEMASKIVVMSGTYFRSDSRPISFLEYEADKPKTHFSIGVTECVRNRYTRQVSFRFHDPVLEILKTVDKSIKQRKLSQIPTASKKMQSVAKREVLDTNGVHVESLVIDAWRELLAMRLKWSDAACLIVCRSGTQGEEERAIHAVENIVNRVTGHRPEVVTSDDSSSRGRIDHFKKTADPFLCAIRMVSEGVDVPRVRMILFLSYTDSEMLFRQIVGRCARYIPGKEDDTAALVILPKFKVMAEFAKRYEDESISGALNLEPLGPVGPGEGCQRCGQSPCVCTCPKCDSKPCRCYVVLDSESVADGGQIASTDVAERFIERARIIRDSSQAHQHANTVQLGDALQRSAQMGEAAMVESVNDRRQLAWKSIDRKVQQIARYFYDGDISSAWINEIHVPFSVKADEIKSTWRLSQIEDLHKHLKNRIAEGL